MGSLWRWWAVTPESGGIRVHPCFMLTVIDSFLSVCDCKIGCKIIFKLFGFKIKLRDRYATVNSSCKVHGRLCDHIYQP